MFVHPTPAQVAMKLRRLLLLCGLAALILPGVASAAYTQVDLADLLPGAQNSGGFVIGDKRYSNFTFASTGPRPIPTPLQHKMVMVDVTTADKNPAIPGDDNYTLRFTFGIDAMNFGERNDLVLCYQVDVIDPNNFINQVGLSFTPIVRGSGAVASVAETVQTVDGSDLEPGLPFSPIASLSVVTDPDGSGPLRDDLKDFISVNPTRSLMFCKDIMVSTTPNGGYAAISIVDNIVDQIPEPSVLGLAAFACGGLLFRRRR
jgi:hypothetical protein